MHVLMHTIVTHMQWNFSTVDTIWIQLAVPYREVSTQLYVAGTADSVLIREVSFIQSVLYREDLLFTVDCAC